MAFDGVTIASVIHELKQKLHGGRIDKIHQPEPDELIISTRSAYGNVKLLLSANSSHPRLHLVNSVKSNPLQAPQFCMVLRKHIGGGRILNINQPGFDRIVRFEIEAVNEMGDMTVRSLIIEIMGKHSNIILTDENSIIIDSIKRITSEKSSVREVLPKKDYFYPPAKGKNDPLMENMEGFNSAISLSLPAKLQNAIYQRYNGISPVMANELCHRAGVDPSVDVKDLSPQQVQDLWEAFSFLFNTVKEGAFKPEIIIGDRNKYLEFFPVETILFSNMEKRFFDSMSNALEEFYSERDTMYRTGQKTADIRKIIQLNIERCVKKQEMYAKTMDEIKDREKYKLCGELLTANIYGIKKGMTTFTTVNFYSDSGEEITIELDPELSPAENAQKYFKKYAREKRTYTAVMEQIKRNAEEMNYLDSVMATLPSAVEESDVEDIREELASQGFIKKRKTHKNDKMKKSKPLHFISKDGFSIYVGKNNRQNDELTMKFAASDDIWLHTKDIPGSHVIIRTNGEQPPDATLTEAAQLAAYYSKARDGSHVPVDYTIKKNVKKPNNAKPGMVIYDKYKTAYVSGDKLQL